MKSNLSPPFHQPCAEPAVPGRAASTQDTIPMGKEPSTSALLALLNSPASAGNSTGTNLPIGFAQAKFSCCSKDIRNCSAVTKISSFGFWGPLTLMLIVANPFPSMACCRLKGREADCLRKRCLTAAVPCVGSQSRAPGRLQQPLHHGCDPAVAPFPPCQMNSFALLVFLCVCIQMRVEHLPEPGTINIYTSTACLCAPVCGLCFQALAEPTKEVVKKITRVPISTDVGTACIWPKVTLKLWKKS